MQQPTPTASYSLTLRVRLSSRAGSLGELTMAIGRAGGDIGAIDIVTVGNNYIIRDITVSSASSAHGEQIVETVKDIDGVVDRGHIGHAKGRRPGGEGEDSGDDEALPGARSRPKPLGPLAVRSFQPITLLTLSTVVAGGVPPT